VILPFGGEWSVSVAATAKGTAQHGSPYDYCMYSEYLALQSTLTASDDGL